METKFIKGLIIGFFIVAASTLIAGLTPIILNTLSLAEFSASTLNICTVIAAIGGYLTTQGLALIVTIRLFIQERFSDTLILINSSIFSAGLFIMWLNYGVSGYFSLDDKLQSLF